MSTDDFEQRIQRQPLRQVPGQWREKILCAARQAAIPQHAPRSAAPSLLVTVRQQLSAFLWPHPAAWAGLAAVWLVILGLNVATRAGTPDIVRRTTPTSSQVFMAFDERARLLSEVIGQRPTSVTEQPKPVLPQPRSERRPRLLMA